MSIKQPSTTCNAEICTTGQLIFGRGIYKYLIDVKLARAPFEVYGANQRNVLRAILPFKLREDIPTRLSNENEVMQACI